MPIDADTYRTEIARRLTARRGSDSLYSTGDSGVGYRVTQRLERAGNHTVDLSTLYLLSLHYGCSLGALLDPHNDHGGTDADTWPADAPSMPDTIFYVRVRLRQLRMELGWGTRRLSAQCAHPSIRPSYLFRIESGEVSHMDVLRLAVVMEAMGASVVDLLPPALRPPGEERLLPNPS